MSQWRAAHRAGLRRGRKQLPFGCAPSRRAVAAVCLLTPCLYPLFTQPPPYRISSLAHLPDLLPVGSQESVNSNLIEIIFEYSLVVTLSLTSHQLSPIR